MRQGCLSCPQRRSAPRCLGRSGRTTVQHLKPETSKPASSPAPGCRGRPRLPGPRPAAAPRPVRAVQCAERTDPAAGARGCPAAAANCRFATLRRHRLRPAATRRRWARAAGASRPATAVRRTGTAARLPADDPPIHRAGPGQPVPRRNHPPAANPPGSLRPCPTDARKRRCVPASPAAEASRRGAGASVPAAPAAGVPAELRGTRRLPARPRHSYRRATRCRCDARRPWHWLPPGPSWWERPACPSCVHRPRATSRVH